jgi:hypothetical protein
MSRKEMAGGIGFPFPAGHTKLDSLGTFSPEDVTKIVMVMATFAYDAAMSGARVPRKLLRLSRNRREN